MLHVCFQHSRIYDQLCRKFNKAEFIGYVPPISAWDVESKCDKVLKNYLETIYRISQIISPFYDFSAPSKITSTIEDTYDGSHYTVHINELIANRLKKNHQNLEFVLI